MNRTGTYFRRILATSRPLGSAQIGLYAKGLSTHVKPAVNVKVLDKVQDPSRANHIAVHDPILKLSFTYQQLDQYSNHIAREFIQRNLHNKTASIGCLNHSPLTFTLSMLATWKIGKVFVPLSISHSVNELSYFIQDSSMGAVVCFNKDDLATDKWAALGAGTLIELESIVKSHQDRLVKESIRLHSGSDALVLYTSGTTGQPKGVVHTHDSIEHIIKSLIEAWQYDEKDKILHFLPLYHMHGLLNKLLCMLWAGGNVEFLASAKAKVIWHRLAQEAATLATNPHPVSLFMAVPTVYAKMLEYSKTMNAEEKEAGIKAMKHMRLMVCGSAALPDPVMDNWYTLTGQRLLERYGMTELGMALSNPYQGERRKGAVGFPLPYVNVRLVDEQGHVIDKTNTPGELQVMGKTVFKRYLNKPEATRDTFDGNWFKTGDIAEVSDDGYYKILGRNSTDIIKSAGYKISALEIEREILSYPKVREVAVVGLKHDELGEMVAAIIALREEYREDGKVNEIQKELDEHLSDKLAKYKTPRKYYVVNALPRNHLGKVNKKSIIKDLNL